MEAALYHPEYGYYAHLRGFGAEGDFITSPELHPTFGAMLGRQVLDAWEALGKPDPFLVHEVGGGSGALAWSLLTWASVDEPDFAAAIHYSLDERSPSLRVVQQQKLAGFDRVTWGQPESAHVVLANEVLDAFPVYRVVRRGTLREMRVGLDGNSFAWVEVDGVPDAVGEYFARLAQLPPEGGIVEVNTELRPWGQWLVDYLRPKKGLGIVLDYGYLADELLARKQGTLLTYYKHTLGSDPFVHIGQQDISTHVDFSTLARPAQEAGIKVGLTPQNILLRGLGHGQYVRALANPADRKALAQLVDGSGLGRIRALFVSHDTSDWVAAALVGTRTWPTPKWLPSVPEANPEVDDFLSQWREAFGIRHSYE